MIRKITKRNKKTQNLNTIREKIQDQGLKIKTLEIGIIDQEETQDHNLKIEEIAMQGEEIQDQGLKTEGIIEEVEEIPEVGRMKEENQDDLIDQDQEIEEGEIQETDLMKEETDNLLERENCHSISEIYTRAKLSKHKILDFLS